MSTQSIPFESINLEPSVPHFTRPNVLTDTSDDGLDPNDFISQSQTHTSLLEGPHGGSDMETSLEQEDKISSRDTTDGMPSQNATPALSNSLNLSLSRDSLFFSFGNFRDPLGPRNMGPVSDSPIEYLLQRQETLNRDMRQAMSLHKEYLMEGEDCTGARTTISKLFASLSENALSLQEVYSKEASQVDQTLSSFKAWDKKRTKVLSRIQRIKSKNNQYGAKLEGLLSKRSSLDNEIDSLQARLDSLKSSRSALNREVDETMSVLESKSAKYVNLFRNLEKAGADAVRDYLNTDGSSESGPLLRYENVNATFRRDESQSDLGIGNMKTPPIIAPITTTTTTTNKPPSPGAIGAQAFEVPEQKHTINDAHSAYEKGFAKGAEQLNIVKHKLSSMLHNVLPPSKINTISRENVIYKPLGDSSDTITSKLDLKPIVDLLSSKSEALDDLVLHASKVSEKFHKHGLAWSETCKYLNSQEELLSQSISTSSSASEAQKVLESAYTYLRRLLDEESNSNILRLDDEKDYFKILTGQELLTIATALEQISGQSDYVSSVLASNTLLQNPTREVRKPKDLRYSITSISSSHAVRDYALAAAAAPRQMGKTTKYPTKIVEKDVKNE